MEEFADESLVSQGRCRGGRKGWGGGEKGGGGGGRHAKIPLFPPHCTHHSTASLNSEQCKFYEQCAMHCRWTVFCICISLVFVFGCNARGSMCIAMDCRSAGSDFVPWLPGGECQVAWTVFCIFIWFVFVFGLYLYFVPWLPGGECQVAAKLSNFIAPYKTESKC